jgi:hypothetical protein
MARLKLWTKREYPTLRGDRRGKAQSSVFNHRKIDSSRPAGFFFRQWPSRQSGPHFPPFGYIVWIQCLAGFRPTESKHHFRPFNPGFPIVKRRGKSVIVNVLPFTEAKPG